jgi:hypothetical protein
MIMRARAPTKNHRQHSRQQLILKVEFDGPAGFRSDFLSNLSSGGLRIDSSLEVGQRFTLHISFLGFVEPIQIEAEVQWAIPASHPEGPASGLAFLDPSPDAQYWLSDILDSSTVIRCMPDMAERVVLLESEPFLREVYGQEVRNWSELRDEEPLELLTFAAASQWLDEITCKRATLGIVDIDDVPDGMELYRRVRANRIACDTPLILLGTPEHLAPFAQLPDELLWCLQKPLRFGALMNTVRMLAREGSTEE